MNDSVKIPIAMKQRPTITVSNCMQCLYKYYGNIDNKFMT